MKVAVITLNFGEPAHGTLDEVVPFLERIFSLNAQLEDAQGEEQRRARVRELAERRAPGLIAEYELIGGSPLHVQVREEADALQDELAARGHDARVYVGMQFTPPFIDDAIRQARDGGAELVIGLPVYPLCGPSTTIAALEHMRRAIDALGWRVPAHEITGWHTHTAYTEIRADAIRKTLIHHNVELNDPRTKLVFSAHGTPMKYVQQGSRYVEYVEDVCRAVAGALGIDDYTLGYQNHTNRPIEWTQPDIAHVIEEIDADAVVVDACSFMHEQSETLAELDHELKEQAEARGLRYYRVPVPYDDPRFITLLADLVEPFIVDEVESRGLRPCLCRAGAYCLNRVL